VAQVCIDAVCLLYEGTRAFSLCSSSASCTSFTSQSFSTMTWDTVYACASIARKQNGSREQRRKDVHNHRQHNTTLGVARASPYPGQNCFAITSRLLTGPSSPHNHAYLYRLQPCNNETRDEAREAMSPSPSLSALPYHAYHHNTHKHFLGRIKHPAKREICGSSH
jgi:hypothetical protein